jgi:hypothetical protein
MRSKTSIVIFLTQLQMLLLLYPLKAQLPKTNIVAKLNQASSSELE